jgi:iron complex outermembrane receptor protein
MFLPLIAFGQITFSGQVIDKQTGESLPGAHILIAESELSATTDKQGNFMMQLKSGQYNFIVSYIGYKKAITRLSVLKNLKHTFELTPDVYMKEEVIIRATRAQKKSPTTYSELSRKQIQVNNLGKDLPYLLELTPSVVTTSDAGGGIGYTGIRIRGTDISRINVTMNGVPVNDAESHSVFFVDLPDLASSVDNIQIQRGVGTSTNGAAAFGASINIQTNKLNTDPYAEISSAAGSFNTFKNTVRFGSGLIANHWAFDGRYSIVSSDGYIDRGWSDLNSFYLSGGYYGKKSIVKAIVTSGKEKTYQAWYGIPKDSLATNRTYNPSGAMENEEGNIIGYYDNQIDNYKQDYYQLHFAHQINPTMNFTFAGFYTRGYGFYESYKNDRSYEEYGLSDVITGNDTITSTNLIQQKWLDNHFYGGNFAFNVERSKLQGTFGVSYTIYDGDHYGYIIWADHAGSFINDPWYKNNGLKKDLSIFEKINYQFNEQFNLFVDFQFRSINYKIEGIHDNLKDLTQSHNYTFFNPKGGVHFTLNEHNSAYASVAVANREPNRSVFRDADEGQEIKPETLTDYEAGYKFTTSKLSLEGVLYYMHYKDQLVLTGQINNVGEAILVNVDKSYRMGIEIIAGIKFSKKVSWDINGTFSQNKITDFNSYTDNWDTWPEQNVENLGTTDISFSPNIIAGSSLKYAAFKSFEAVLHSQYVGRQYIDNRSNINRSLDPYFVNNLKFIYSIQPAFLKQIDFILSLNNFLNEEYETNAWVYRYYFDNEEYEMNGYFPQAKFNFMAGINFSF